MTSFTASLLSYAFNLSHVRKRWSRVCCATAILPAVLLLSVGHGVHAQSELFDFGNIETVKEIKSLCEPLLTVQNNNCSVDHVYQCTAIKKGLKIRERYNEQGGQSLSVIDEEHRHLFTFPLTNQGDERVERLIVPETDPASLNELFEKGTDYYSFRHIELNIGGELSTLQNPNENRTIGFDRLTGGFKEIGGQVLLETQFAYSYSDSAGDLLFFATGNQYVSQEFWIFFSGNERYSTLTGHIEVDASPQDLIIQGNIGFMSEKPLFGCGETL